MIGDIRNRLAVDKEGKYQSSSIVYSNTMTHNAQIALVGKTLVKQQHFNKGEHVSTRLKHLI